MKHILIIEDDMNLQRMYTKALTVAGYETDPATTAMEGFTKAKAQTPDLLLLDIMLPGGKNGFDMIQMMKTDEVLKAVPIICFTNLDSEKDTALDMGANDYIVKANLSIEKLIEKVKSILG